MSVYHQSEPQSINHLQATLNPFHLSAPLVHIGPSLYGDIWDVLQKTLNFTYSMVGTVALGDSRLLTNDVCL